MVNGIKIKADSVQLRLSYAIKRLFSPPLLCAMSAMYLITKIKLKIKSKFSILQCWLNYSLTEIALTKTNTILLNHLHTFFFLNHFYLGGGAVTHKGLIYFVYFYSDIKDLLIGKLLIKNVNTFLTPPPLSITLR